MGAPKLRWTEEEESALKAGIAKHGIGRWRTILKDPQFSHILYSRSNVDLKDKWRNMNVSAYGSGSRGKARITWKKSRLMHQYDDNPMALSTIDDLADDVVDVQPLAVSGGTWLLSGPNGSMSKLEDIIMEAIKKMNEPNGSNKTTIGTYIEATCRPPPYFREHLGVCLEELTANGKLIKVKHRYRIAPTTVFSKGRSSKVLLLEGREREPYRVDRGDFKHLKKSVVDAELARMRNMTEEEAAAAAAQAVSEAEAAMAEAETAVREAEIAEAEAEELQAFAASTAAAAGNGNVPKIVRTS